MAFLAIAAAAHIIALALLLHMSNRAAAGTPSSSIIMTAVIEPKIREDSQGFDPEISRILLRVERPLLHIDQPALDVGAARNGSASSAAPTLITMGVQDMGPYVRLAALLPGEGATVVLRVEVLASGDPGRIEIDTSSGSHQVDDAAIAYARSMHWNAGRLDGQPRSMWVRWGVRLQA